MKKSTQALAGVLAAFALTGAARGASPDDGKRYRVSYEWRAGALFPRSHYQYRIEIEPDGKGNIVMVPEYPTIYDVDIPRWKETFSVDAAELRKLNGFIESNDMLSSKWQDPAKKEKPLSLQPPEAPSCRIEVLDVRIHDVPCNEWEIPDSLLKKRDEFADMMKKLVPAKSWARLNVAQRDYASH